MILRSLMERCGRSAGRCQWRRR